VPFVSKATSLPLAKIAASCMTGKTLPEMGYTKEVVPPYFCVKEAVFPFSKFPGADPILGPEMKSTGEVMGVGKTFGEAYYKAQLGAGTHPSSGGNAIISVKDSDKDKLPAVARNLISCGFSLTATGGTYDSLRRAKIEVKRINKVSEGRPHIVDTIKNDEVDYIVNTTEGKKAIADSYKIRRSAIEHKVVCSTTIAGSLATCEALKHAKDKSVHTIQELHEKIK